MSYLKAARQSLEAIRQQPQPSIERPHGESAVPTAEQVAAMCLEEFAQAGLIVQVRSCALDRDVLFVSDNVDSAILPGGDLVAYRPHELQKLALLRPDRESLRRMHEVKCVFQGTICTVETCKEDGPVPAEGDPA